MIDHKNAKRWLGTLATHYPSLLVSGVAHAALAEMEALSAGIDLTVQQRDEAEAALTIAVEALEELTRDMPDEDPGYDRDTAYNMGFESALFAQKIIAQCALAKIKEMN